MNMICPYTLQVGLYDNVKQEFWQDIDTIVQNILQREMISLVGDFNGHIDKATLGYDGINGNFGFVDRNNGRNDILDMVMTNDLFIANTFK